MTARVLRWPLMVKRHAEGTKAGRGLRNMQSRAARCGAGLDLTSGAGGTRVRLTLPHRFPDSDAKRNEFLRIALRSSLLRNPTSFGEPVPLDRIMLEATAARRG